MKKSLLLISVLATVFLLAGSAQAATYPSYTWNAVGIDTSKWNTSQAGGFFSQPGDGYLHISAPSANANNFIATYQIFSPGIEFWMSVHDFYTPILSGSSQSQIGINLVKAGSQGAYAVQIVRHETVNGMGNFYAQWVSGGTLQQSASVPYNTLSDFQLGIQWSGNGQITLAYKLGTNPQTPSIPLLTVANPGFTQAVLSIGAETGGNNNFTALIGTIGSGPFQSAVHRNTGMLLLLLD